MSLIRWNPFKEMDRFFEENDWFLPVISSSSLIREPSIDLYQTEKDVIAEISLPDVNPEDVEVSVENGMLTVKGETEKKEEEKKKQYWRKEIYRGSFERSIRIPVEVEEDKIEARYQKGVLKVVMPKKESEKLQKKKIKIQVKD